MSDSEKTPNLHVDMPRGRCVDQDSLLPTLILHIIVNVEEATGEHIGVIGLDQRQAISKKEVVETAVAVRVRLPQEYEAALCGRSKRKTGCQSSQAVVPVNGTNTHTR